MTIKEMFKDSKETCVKTHLSCGCGGIDGFYSAKELIKYYGDCECEIVEYIDEDGFDEETGPIVYKRKFLKIYTFKNYADDIELDRFIEKPLEDKLDWFYKTFNDLVIQSNDKYKSMKVKKLYITYKELLKVVSAKVE